MISIALALALVLPQEEPLTVDKLTYSETYACAALGFGAQEWLKEGLNGTAPDAETQRLLTALEQLTAAATNALGNARARDGLSDAQVTDAQTAVFTDLGENDDETLFALTDLCGTIFGVNFE